MSKLQYRYLLGAVTRMVAAVLLVSSTTFATDDDSLAKEAQATLEKATAFFRTLSTNGGYLWWYSEDLKARGGERKATETQIWVQPPGTPAVGMAFPCAYEVTKDKRYLEAASAAADALVWGQLASGGWDYLIDFDLQNSQRWYRRAEMGLLSPDEIPKRRNSTTFDDNTTQSALRFLMTVQQLTNSPAQQQAIEYGLQGLLAAQYKNGAFPQRYEGKPRDFNSDPLKRAQLPPSYPHSFPHQGYGAFYTFNDNTIRHCILTLLDAYQRYGKGEFLEAAKRGGDFIILAQLPAPQTAWAQQYDFDMFPAWAREFEPPAVCSSESGGVVRTLVDLYLASGEEKYLQPIPAAINWFKRSQIAPNQWARFYELGSNKPLYFTKDYQLVYSDGDLPTHYSFKGKYDIPAVIAYYEEVKRLGRDAYLERQQQPLTSTQKAARRQALEPLVRKVMAALDDKGRWVVNGRVESRVFQRNVQILCDYLEVVNP